MCNGPRSESTATYSTATYSTATQSIAIESTATEITAIKSSPAYSIAIWSNKACGTRFRVRQLRVRGPCTLDRLLQRKST